MGIGAALSPIRNYRISNRMVTAGKIPCTTLQKLGVGIESVWLMPYVSTVRFFDAWAFDSSRLTVENLLEKNQSALLKLGGLAVSLPLLGYGFYQVMDYVAGNVPDNLWHKIITYGGAGAEVGLILMGLGAFVNWARNKVLAGRIYADLKEIKDLDFEFSKSKLENLKLNAAQRELLGKFGRIESELIGNLSGSERVALAVSLLEKPGAVSEEILDLILDRVPPREYSQALIKKLDERRAKQLMSAAESALGKVDPDEARIFMNIAKARELCPQIKISTSVAQFYVGFKERIEKKIKAFELNDLNFFWFSDRLDLYALFPEALAQLAAKLLVEGCALKGVAAGLKVIAEKMSDINKAKLVMGIYVNLDIADPERILEKAVPDYTHFLGPESVDDNCLSISKRYPYVRLMREKLAIQQLLAEFNKNGGKLVQERSKDLLCWLANLNPTIWFIKDLGAGDHAERVEKYVDRLFSRRMNHKYSDEIKDLSYTLLALRSYYDEYAGRLSSRFSEIESFADLEKLSADILEKAMRAVPLDVASNLSLLANREDVTKVGVDNLKEALDNLNLDLQVLIAKNIYFDPGCLNPAILIKTVFSPETLVSIQEIGFKENWGLERADRLVKYEFLDSASRTYRNYKNFKSRFLDDPQTLAEELRQIAAQLISDETILSREENTRGQITDRLRLNIFRVIRDAIQSEPKLENRLELNKLFRELQEDFETLAGELLQDQNLVGREIDEIGNDLWGNLPPKFSRLTGAVNKFIEKKIKLVEESLDRLELKGLFKMNHSELNDLFRFVPAKTASCIAGLIENEAELYYPGLQRMVQNLKTKYQLNLFLEFVKNDKISSASVRSIFYFAGGNIILLRGSLTKEEQERLDEANLLLHPAGAAAKEADRPLPEAKVTPGKTEGAGQRVREKGSTNGAGGEGNSGK